MSLCFSDRSSQFASVASYQTSDSEENTGEEDTDEDYGNFKEDFEAGAYTDSGSDNSDTFEGVDGQVSESDNTDLKDLESESTVSRVQTKYCPFFEDYYETEEE
jgi:hypothetical protein